MTTPRLSHSTKFGRLYQRPETHAEEIGSPEEALSSGILVPSVTNIIDTLAKPYLRNWYSKLAAEEAVRLEKAHPGLIKSKPSEANKWIAKAAERSLDVSASLGDKVHNATEMLARGEEPEIDAKIRPYIDSWEKFILECEPDFLYLEATTYGTTDKDGAALGFAGTADFIATINEKTYVGDYKTGKAIHTEASLQLSALAHTDEIFDEETNELSPLPEIHGGLVVHITDNGYQLYTVTDLEQPWVEFQRLRGIWDFHQKNLNTRAPLFLEKGLN
jgi:hypothetical protein